jgi:hypothetical protein
MNGAMTGPTRVARRHAALALLATWLSACTGTPAHKPASGLAELMDRPGERALVEGIRAYDDGQYPQAEAALRQALGAGLASPRDRASAHKLLAFISCTSERMAECEAQFRAARAADPAFTLGRGEAGHPLWGPVYRQVVPAP